MCDVRKVEGVEDLIDRTSKNPLVLWEESHKFGKSTNEIYVINLVKIV